jgi:ribosomal protein S18 acetylase RimI-like enzyme
MIAYRESHEIDLDQLAALMRSAGWTQRADDRARLAQQVTGSRYVVSAWDGERLVGFARALSDGATNAYVSTVVVLPEYQRKGIGREIMTRLLAGNDGIRFVLHAARPEVKGFYEKLGFSDATDMMWRGRKF